MSTMRLCDVKGCSQPITHRAEVVIYAGVAQLHPPAIAALGLFVCQGHATEELAGELLTPEGKAQLNALFAKAGKARPNWKSSFARWVPLRSE